jgi:citrate lyase subunit beta/citryl-CoA lyase
MTINSDTIANARSMLFVPGHRPGRFDKAASSGSDLVIIDLEDAVATEDKEHARVNANEWLAGGNDAILRINAPGTPWFVDDLMTAVHHGCPIMVPKAEDAAVLTGIADRTDGKCPLIPLIETAVGVERAAEICATAGTVRAAFGNVDLAAQLGVSHDDHLALQYARSRLVSASTAAELCPPVDGVTISLRDPDALSTDVTHARRLGFTGKLCIHPVQIRAVAVGFAPTETELRWAHNVLTAADRLTVIDGQMVDRPILKRAQRILAANAPGDA